VIKFVQTTSPNIKKVQVPQEDFCECEDFTPTSDGNVPEEGIANPTKEPITSPMVFF